MVDFDITLTRDQPTSFVASRGRLADPSEAPCSFFSDQNQEPILDCYGAGFDPGNVPPMPQGFTGELRCIEADAAGFAINGNHLIGAAVLVDVASGDATRYGALGIRGVADNDGDGELRLGDEYDGCPQSLVFGHETDGSADPQLGGASTVENVLTLTACSIDYLSQVPESVTLNLQVTNDLAQSFSASRSISGWTTTSLRDIDGLFSAEVLGAPVAQTVIRAAQSSPSGLLGIVEAFHRAGDGRQSAAATNVHLAGTRSAVDVMLVP